MTNKDFLEHEEWILTLNHFYVDKDGLRSRLDEPVAVSVIQPFGNAINVSHDVYNKLLYEMERYLKNE